MHLPDSPERMPGRQRWSGIRAKLLILLLPSITLMLGVDSWGDHRDRMNALESAYDATLMESLYALDHSVRTDRNGAVDLTVPVAVQTVFESVQARFKHLHVGLTPVDADATVPPVQRTLIGTADLPAAPPDAEMALAPLVSGSPDATHIAFYSAAYRGYPVRIAALQREMRDPSGRRYLLRVRAAESMDQRDDAWRVSLRHELLQGLRTLVATALLVWWGTAWALRPLARLRSSLLERPAHNLQPLDVSSVPREVAPLVDAVNIHIAEHRKLLGEQSKFLEDASHQLRTPLAIMMTQAGYALRERDPELLHETLRAVIAQLGRSRRLSDQLLSLAHASLADNETEPLPLIDLNLVAREVVLHYLPLAREKNQDLGWVDLRGEGMPYSVCALPVLAAPVRAQASEVHEALANLLHNAIRYTPAGGSITVAVRIAGDVAFVEVIDAGPGIAPQRREQVFQRLRCGGTPQTTDGAGLGLAIARAYARRNGGDVDLSDAGHGHPGSTGLCARIVFPLAVVP